MVRPKSSGRCVGVQRCSKILYEMLSRKLVLAVQRAASASIYNRQTTLAELTTAQSVILAIMNSLLTEDLEFCNLLLKLYSSVEQLRSSYLTVWLRDDFDFPEEDVSKVLMTVARLVNGGILDMPDHVLRVFRGLAGKYHVVESCQHEKDFETIKFLIEGESDEGCNEYAVKESTEINEKKGSNSITPKITVDGGDLKTAYYSGEEFPKKFVLKNINFKEVAEATKNYGIAKSSSDTNILGRGARNRRKATLSMLIDEKEESTLAHSSGIPYKSGSVTDIPQSHGIHVSRFRRSSIDRYRNAISKKDENTVFEISHSGKRTEVAADNRKSYNISKSSSALNLRSNIADIIEEKSPVTEDKPFYNIYKSSSARCVRSHIAETPTSDLLPSDPVNTDSRDAAVVRKYLKLPSILPDEELRKRLCNEDGEGRTPLERASFEGRSDIVQTILRIGVDFASRKGKVTAVHLAAEEGNLDVLQLLLDNGADLNEATTSKKKAIHFAAERGHDLCLSWLLLHGADIESKDISWQTPLHKAAAGGHIETVRVLLGNSANLDAEDRLGRLPLHHAAKNGKMDTALVLLDCGSDVNSKDRKGHTPLFFAKEASHQDVVELLKVRGGTED
nr:receptor-interacting serine/threonine-protein kinase 4-like isoform X2 [Halyomorpha halys]